jgi:peroxiredoxin
MALTTGDKAPDATLLQKDADGMVRKRSLSDLIAGRNAVVLFYPMAGSDHCTIELCSVTENLNRYAELGAEVVAISVDNPHAQELWARQQKIRIPMLSDFNKELTRAFGALDEVFVPGILDMHGVAKRSTFVIDREGRVVYAEVLDDARELPDFDRVQRVLRDLAG